MPRDVRRVPIGLVAASAILLVARFGALAYEHAHPPSRASLVHWLPPAAAEQAMADADEVVLYDFSASWCEPCQAMERDVFGNDEDAALVARFIPIRVDGDDKSERAEALRTRFSVDALPTLVITGPLLPAPLSLRGWEGEERTKQFLQRGYNEASPSHGIRFQTQ